MTESKIAKGLEGVVVGETKLSLVDGEKGILVYRGYNIDEIANLSFEDVAHLFIYERLPSEQERKTFSQNLVNRLSLPDHVLNYLVKYGRKDHKMAVLRTAVSMLSIDNKEPSHTDENALKERSLDLIAKTGAIVSALNRITKGHEPIEHKKDYSFSQNFLYQSNEEEPSPILTKTLDTAFILHMDHGFNASTFTARVVASSLSDINSSVVAAIGSLKGPLHGGANTAVMHMLQEIGSLENVESWLARALENKQKIMGFGHRVYKVVDPRAKHLKRLSKEWGDRVSENKWYLMSEKLASLLYERKKLNPNVDFYSASTYYAMGIDPELYTPLFAVARMVGWTAHVIEQYKDNRIMRPDAIYLGDMNKTLF